MNSGKKTLLCLLVLCLLLSLCACGGSPAPDAAEESAKPRPEGMESVLPGAGAQEDEATASDKTATPDEELARSLIGESVDTLFARIGEPLSAEYAPSCLGPGEDGELQYDGFTVYTYRYEGSETVEDVLSLVP